MSESANHWYYLVGGQRTGPISGVELKSLASAGKIGATDLVWKEGMAEWMPASTIKGLVSSTQLNVPPPPPVRPTGPPPIPPSGPPQPSAVVPTLLSAEPLPPNGPAPATQLIAGLHRQRFGIAVAAGLGMLATFLPWVHAPIVGSVAGTAGDGWITLALFIPAMVLALRAEKTSPLSGNFRLGATIPAGLAAVLGLSKFGNLSSFKSNVDKSNPFAKAMSDAVQPGFGLYLLVLSGIALVAMAWILARPTENKI